MQILKLLRNLNCKEWSRLNQLKNILTDFLEIERDFLDLYS